MKQEPVVFAIVLNWNDYEQATRCIIALERSVFVELKIIIVDNASTDASISVLRERFPRHTLIESSRNLGYAGGNNKGIQYSLSQGAEFIWIVNPDLLVKAETAQKLVSCCKSDDLIGICGPLINWIYPTHSERIAGGTILPERGYQPKHRLVSPQDSLMQDVDYVIGCSFFVRRDVFIKMGLFREDFFLYYEEADFCWRAKENGWRVVVFCEAEVDHLYINKKLKSKQYHVIKSAILTARIRKKFLLETLERVLDLPRALSLLRQLRIKEGAYIIKKKLPPVVDGMLQRLKSIPTALL